MDKQVCVVGLGTMGSQIAVVFSRAGFPTRVVESDAERLEQGMDRVKSYLDRKVKRGKLEAGEADAILSRLAPCFQVEKGASGADFALEAVFEDMAAKKAVFAELDRALPPHAVIASNTSTLSITELASATARPDRCVGAHFLIPAAHRPRWSRWCADAGPRRTP